MNRRAYSTDLTDEQWLLVEPYVRTSGYGRPPLHPKRELLNAIFYQGRAGSAWPLLPHDLPPWRTVYKQFGAWRENGTWDWHLGPAPGRAAPSCALAPARG